MRAYLCGFLLVAAPAGVLLVAASCAHPAPAPVLEDDALRVAHDKKTLVHDLCCYSGAPSAAPPPPAAPGRDAGP